MKCVCLFPGFNKFLIALNNEPIIKEEKLKALWLLKFLYELKDLKKNGDKLNIVTTVN